MNRSKTQVLLTAIILALTFAMMFAPAPVQQAAAADGTVGYLSISISQIYTGQPLTIGMTNLGSSADYTLDFTAGAQTQLNFTTGSSQTSKWMTLAIAAPTAGSVCTVTLEQQSTGTAIDTFELSYLNLTDVAPTDPLMDIAMVGLLFGVIALVAGALKVKSK